MMEVENFISLQKVKSAQMKMRNALDNGLVWTKKTADAY